MDPHEKTTKGSHTDTDTHIDRQTDRHTHTHTHTHPKTSSQIRPSLVPLRDFAQLPLLGRHKPHQGEESGTEPSSCISHGLSSGKAEGVPAVGEDESWCHFL